MRTKSTQFNINKILVTHLLLLGIVLSMFLYMYLLNLSAFNGSAVEKMTDQAVTVQSEIAKLEFDFINKNKSIKDIDPLAFGLVQEIEEQDKIFVKKSLANRLTLND